jgi:hypothetical protein
MLRCALAPRFQYRLGHLLDEQGNAIGTLDDVMADAGWQRLVANDAIDDRSNVTFPQPIQSDERHIRSSDPRWLKVGPECHDQQHPKAANPVDDPTEHFKARGVGPMGILEDHQHRSAGLPI